MWATEPMILGQPRDSSRKTFYVKAGRNDPKPGQPCGLQQLCAGLIRGAARVCVKPVSPAEEASQDTKKVLLHAYMRTKFPCVHM